MLIKKTVYFREEDLDKWKEIGNKAAWLHVALGTLDSGGTAQFTIKKLSKGIIDKDTKMITPVEALTDIPGVERASEAVCKGTHYMSRKDCGKPGCPWKGIK